jgi:hypothetical protein
VRHTYPFSLGVCYSSLYPLFTPSLIGLPPVESLYVTAADVARSFSTRSLATPDPTHQRSSVCPVPRAARARPCSTNTMYAPGNSSRSARALPSFHTRPFPSSLVPCSLYTHPSTAVSCPCPPCSPFPARSPRAPHAALPPTRRPPPPPSQHTYHPTDITYNACPAPARTSRIHQVPTYDNKMRYPSPAFVHSIQFLFFFLPSLLCPSATGRFNVLKHLVYPSPSSPRAIQLCTSKPTRIACAASGELASGYLSSSSFIQAKRMKMMLQANEGGGCLL